MLAVLPGHWECLGSCKHREPVAVGLSLCHECWSQQQPVQ